jgi:hypothetical protein
MLTARPNGIWKTRYAISSDGETIATWAPSLWKVGGHFELAGQRYEVRANIWGSKYGMADADGALVAAAERVRRKHWSVEADGQTYEFQRTSMWRHEQELCVRGQRAGSVKRVSMWRRDVVADLPGLRLPVQIFVLAIALTKWDSTDAA